MMKKELLFMATAALAASSCTQVVVDDVAATPREPIRFEQFVGKATRTGDVTTANLTQYRVVGKMYIGDSQSEDIDVMVTKTGDSWTSYPEIYWEDGAKYYFAATNETNSNGFKCMVKDDDHYLYNAEYSVDRLTAFDLVTAVCPAITGKQFGNAAVSFDFRHALAKVQFTFVNGYADDTKVDIPDPALECILDRGSLEHRFGEEVEWQPKTTQNYQIMGGVTLTHPGESQTQTVYVIPQDIHSDGAQGTNLTFHMTVEGTDVKNELITVGVPNDVVSKWEAGKAYNYKLTVKPKTDEQEEVKFEVDIDSWDNAEDADLEDVEISEN